MPRRKTILFTNCSWDYELLEQPLSVVVRFLSDQECVRSVEVLFRRYSAG